MFRIFRVDAAFDRMTFRFQFTLDERQFLTERNPNLPLDQVDSIDHLRDAVFNLDSGIHLHEVKIFVLVHEEFNCSNTLIIDALCATNSCLPDLFAERLVYRR